MTLPTRPLGSSGLDITTVGFGAWAIGGGGWAFGWGPQDDADSLAAMRRALERGVNWIDTAAVYGLGHSEEMVGRLLRELPAGERPLVFTKCGLAWDERDPMKEAQRVLRPDSIRKECDASLRRLGVERIDLYQFHWPDETGTPVEDSWQAMVRLVEEGKVRAAGVSNFDASLLERCEAIRHVDSLQPPFSLIRRDAAEREIPWCAEHDTGVIVYSPMQSGLLTDSFTAARVAALAPDDWRRRSPQFQAPAPRCARPPHPPPGGGGGGGPRPPRRHTVSGSAAASAATLPIPLAINAAACVLPMPRSVTRRAAARAARASPGLRLARYASSATGVRAIRNTSSQPALLRRSCTP